jgi:hypothetical protein
MPGPWHIALSWHCHAQLADAWVVLPVRDSSGSSVQADHNLEAYLDAYIEAAGIRDGGKAPLYLAVARHEAVGEPIGGWEPAAPQGQ